MKKKIIILLCLLVCMILVSCQSGQSRTDGDHKRLTDAFLDQPSSYLRVHYIDVGQADATLLQLVDGEEIINMLIDTGDWNSTDVVDYLQAQNITTVDLIAITHPHADHIGQLAKIIRKFHVEEVWMNGESANSQVFLDALEAIEEKGVAYYEPEAGEEFEIGNLQLHVLHPETLTSNTNNNSLVMHMTYKEIALLFTGDAELQVERALLAKGDKIDAHILHLGHHGSKTSTSEDFLQKVHPEIAIYSAGKGNSYGHPDKEVIDLIKKQSIPLYGTNQDGTILLETDGEKYYIMTETEGTLPPALIEKACIDVNTATADELQQIIHIGEKTANELMNLRPYSKLDDLLEIKGIGTSRLEDIKEQDLACIGG